MQLLYSDPLQCAKAIDLTYVSDAQRGITRVKKGKHFIYMDGDARITDTDELERIRKIVIPPAWEKVWICRSPKGHIQATGFDKRNRKQYRYHLLWNQLRNHTKFSRLLAFGEKLPQIRLQVESDLSIRELNQRKVLAVLISLIERTYIRVGNSEYEKLYGSYGLTTLKDQHVQIKGSQIRFSFKGKKGVHHHLSVTNKKLARIVKQCREIPGKELFQYYDEQGQTHTIDSGDVNAYIRELSGEEFTAKDFRTWAGTLHALHAFQELGEALNQADCKKKIVEALDYVSTQLGNTRTVCKKYYVHPLVMHLYESQALKRYFHELDRIEKDDNLTGWTAEELVLLKILRGSRRQELQIGA